MKWVAKLLRVKRGSFVTDSWREFTQNPFISKVSVRITVADRHPLVRLVVHALSNFMKDKLFLPGLVVLAILIVAAVLYVAPLILDLLPNVSYKYVLFFLVLIVASNVLAKISAKYISA